jgi:hypothetical protein
MPDPGFAPAGNSLIVFLGMEVVILVVALAQAVPFLVAGLILTVITPLSLRSKLLHIMSCFILGVLLAAGWFSVCRGGFDVIAETLTIFASIGFLVSGVCVSTACRA